MKILYISLFILLPWVLLSQSFETSPINNGMEINITGKQVPDFYNYYGGDLKLDLRRSNPLSKAYLRFHMNGNVDYPVQYTHHVDFGLLTKNQFAIYKTNSLYFYPTTSLLSINVSNHQVAIGDTNFIADLTVKRFLPNSNPAIYAESLGSGLIAKSHDDHGVQATTTSPNHYAGYFDGDVYTTGMYLPSDARLKYDIEPIPKALDILQSLEPVQYRYHSDQQSESQLPKGKRLGLIAQDLENILPNLVKDCTMNELDREGKLTRKRSFQAVNYVELIPLLISGIQEQQITIEKLSQRIKQLEKAHNQ